MFAPSHDWGLTRMGLHTISVMLLRACFAVTGT